MPAPQDIALRAPGGPELAGLLWPAPAGAPGVVIVHGLGSRKENHADFAELVAGAGMAALAIDLRGHGASGGELDEGLAGDVIAGLDALAARGHAPLGVRGSSLGGLLALHAARVDPRVRAAVALCPARPDRLAERLGEDWPRALSRRAAPARRRRGARLLARDRRRPRPLGRDLRPGHRHAAAGAAAGRPGGRAPEPAARPGRAGRDRGLPGALLAVGIR